MADQEEKKPDDEKGDHINLKVKDQVRDALVSLFFLFRHSVHPSLFFCFFFAPSRVREGETGQCVT